jgi:hypothetical protein
MDFGTFLSILWNATEKFLAGFLDTFYLGPTLVCFAIAYLFYPNRWPKFIGYMGVSIIAGAIGIVALLLLFKFPFAVAATVAMVEIFAGLLWARSRPKKLFSRILLTILVIVWFFFTVYVVMNYSNLNSLSGSIPTIWSLIQQFATFVYDAFGEWLKSF